MKDDDLSLREKLNELMVRLRLVQLKQECIEKAAGLIKKILNYEKSIDYTPSKKERSYTSTFEPEIGDHIRIRNPQDNQPSEGIVRGFCSDGKLKIGDNKTFILRLPKNVACIGKRL